MAKKNWCSEYAKIYKLESSIQLPAELHTLTTTGTTTQKLVTLSHKGNKKHIVYNTDLHKRLQLCQNFMKKEGIQTKKDYLTWLQTKFNPNNKEEASLVQDIALCLLLSCC